jgi:hypothetical protein
MTSMSAAASNSSSGGFPGLRRLSGSKPVDRSAELQRWTSWVRTLESDGELDSKSKVKEMRRFVADRLAASSVL